MECCQKASNEYNFCPQCGQRLDEKLKIKQLIGNRLGSSKFNLSNFRFVSNNCNYSNNIINEDLIYAHLFTNECENVCSNGTIDISPTINCTLNKKYILSINKIIFKVEKEKTFQYSINMDIEYDLLDFDKNYTYNGPRINNNDLYLKFNCDIKFKHHIYIDGHLINNIKLKVYDAFFDMKYCVEELSDDFKKIKASESKEFLKNLGFELIE